LSGNHPEYQPIDCDRDDLQENVSFMVCLRKLSKFTDEPTTNGIWSTTSKFQISNGPNFI